MTFDFLDPVYDMCLLWLYHFYAYEQFMMFFSKGHVKKNM